MDAPLLDGVRYLFIGSGAILQGYLRQRAR